LILGRESYQTLRRARRLYLRVSRDLVMRLKSNAQNANRTCISPGFRPRLPGPAQVAKTSASAD
jgi:hypothetical protein